jgi:hypothetical protein
MAKTKNNRIGGIYFSAGGTRAARLKFLSQISDIGCFKREGLHFINLKFGLSDKTSQDTFPLDKRTRFNKNILYTYRYRYMFCPL